MEVSDLPGRLGDAVLEIERLRSRLRDIEATADFFVQDGVSADAMRGGHYTIRSKAQAALGPQVNPQQGNRDGKD